jgi:peptide/nickel transport system substrate-binding protein
VFKPHRFPRLLAAAAALALACSDARPPSPAPSDVASAPAPAAATALAATAQRMTIGISQEFENLNPIISQMAASRYIYYLVGHPLLSVDDEWKYVCQLCTELPSLENGRVQFVEPGEAGGERKLRVTWDILPDAKWGDGTPLTGKDVELSWRIGQSPNVSVGVKEPYQIVEAVEVDAQNPKRFSMLFNQARYDYLNQTSQLYIVPAHIEGPIWEKAKDSTGAYEKQTGYATDPSNPGLYSGAYRIGEIKLGSHVQVVANEQFHGGRPAIEQFIVKLVPNTQTLEANLISRNIDMISELGITFDQALAFEKRIARDPSLQVFQTKFRQGLTYEHIDLNLNNPILADLRVRKALIYAIDRQKLVDSLFEGRQQVALHNVHPLDVYYTDDVVKYPYDLARAGQLFEEAGWKLGADGYRYKDGEKFSLQLMTTAQNKTRELVQVFLQDQWKQAGVEITIRNEPARVFFGETVRKSKYPALAMFAWTSSPDRPPREMLHSSMIPTEANGHSGQNSGGWRSEVADRAFDAIQIEFDAEKRKELMKTMLREYTEQVPVIPLYMRSEISVVPSALQNYTMSGHLFYSTLRAQTWSMQ